MKISFNRGYRPWRQIKVRITGRHLYPITIELNTVHFGVRVFHNQKNWPLYTQGWLDLHCNAPSTGTRIWLYSFGRALGHIDISIDRR